MWCVFCGNEKGNEWLSDLTIKIQNRNGTTLTVCPKCRGSYTIKELYSRATEKAMLEAREIIEGFKR